jgi:hypothetical protein
MESVALRSFFGYTDIENVFIRNNPMTTDQIVFAGVDISSGRKPVTFAALDMDLNIFMLEKWNLVECVSCLKDYENILLVINSPARTSQHSASDDFKGKIFQAGFGPMSKNDPRQWVETDTQKSFLTLCENELLPRRSLEGRIQRALILYAEGLQIPDPMDFFEEITRHKLLQGILPMENLHSAKELDALIAAYVAWIAVNRPNQVELLPQNIVLPRRVER